ncbi:hypothetical protein SK355_11770 (plasmid) [Candidatus Fukatsuia symbiotica]|uniref:hypothetical protein n=1 Tax=Candidatus Fukatsuia symbiotica TaxID=1878942 RepID=UPI0013C2C1F6|nr:hypothetical protein [Candidatus Fukatsuia symbiotica]MEA9445853.1 hypothetical protein [Candidatus Fukatsuia symbiotica]
MINVVLYPLPLADKWINLVFSDLLNLYEGMGFPAQSCTLNQQIKHLMPDVG